jgi:hypothetical protein
MLSRKKSEVLTNFSVGKPETEEYLAIPSSSEKIILKFVH